TSIPVVTVTLIDPPADDNVVCIKNLTVSGFTVASRDIDPVSPDSSSPQNSAFNFIAVGPRP
ncbi:MAG TPA: hypothetical protein VFL30_07685, partial [Rhodanobacteraceae bacterium]|nr:hypothetical protein [Rhodanobacteraceae bacterium]